MEKVNEKNQQDLELMQLYQKEAMQTSLTSVAALQDASLQQRIATVKRSPSSAKGANPHKSSNELRRTPKRTPMKTMMMSTPESSKKNLHNHSERDPNDDIMVDLDGITDQEYHDISEQLHVDWDEVSHLPSFDLVFSRFFLALSSIYRHYCFSVTASKGTSRIGRAEFSKFLRDCSLSQRLQPAVIEKIYSDCRGLSLNNVTTLSPKSFNISKYSHASPGDSVGSGKERGTVEMTYGDFCRALAVIANALYAVRIDLGEVSKLVYLLLTDVFPLARKEHVVASSASLMSDPITALFAQHRKGLLAIFNYWADHTTEEVKADRKAVTLNLKGWLECLRYYSFLPFVSVSQAREMFRLSAQGKVTQAELQSEKGKEKPFDRDQLAVMTSSIEFEEFLQALGRLGLTGYSRKLLRDAYPSPEARVQKVLVKMLVLQLPKQKDFRGN